MANVRAGTVPRASSLVGGNPARKRRESMPSRKAGHTRADRAVIRPSNVTSRSKADANAGTTAASGIGIPAPDLVSQVVVADVCSL